MVKAEFVSASFEQNRAQAASLRFADRAKRHLMELAASEEGRLGLWAPAALGAGAAFYLLLDREPSLPFTMTLLASACLAGAALRRWRAVLYGVGIFLLGFAAADIRAMQVDAPVLRAPLEFVALEGRLRSIDESPQQRRIVLEVERIGDIARDDLPARVRVTWRGREFDAKPGDLVSLTASLSPPPRPAAPGGFDFARQLYFLRIGAVGYAVSPPIVAPKTDRSLLEQAAARVEMLRVALARRILQKAGGDSGAIVAAVVTGKRGAITDEAQDAFRDAGLAHLLSISGLHMGLATGLIFFAVRGLLALSEKLALTQPIKKWAACAALLSGAAYLLISGGAWPAQRAFIMSSIFFIAIIFDRRALSLRNVAIAAFVIILMTPEAVLHPGFQMSFAAVTALIAAYEWASKRADPLRSFSVLARLRRYVIGVAVTDTIAAFATAPYSLYHFNRAANFGLAANIVSVPLMGFWVMPAAIIAIILAPFNIDGPIWKLAAAGVDVMLVMARWTMNLPGAVTVFPQWPPAALGVTSLGGLWLCLMSRPWRLLGLAALPLSAVLVLLNPAPALYVSEDADNVGLVVNEGRERRFAVFDRSRSRFDVAMWMEQAGVDSRKGKPLKIEEIAPCDERGCVVSLDGKPLAIAKSSVSFDDDCARADLVIALFFVPRRLRENCEAAVIDRRDLYDKGAHAVALLKDELLISNAAEFRGRRPWSAPG